MGQGKVAQLGYDDRDVFFILIFPRYLMKAAERGEDIQPEQVGYLDCPWQVVGCPVAGG